MPKDLSKKQRFEKVAGKAFENGGTDYFGIAKNNTRAVIGKSEVSQINNALVIVKSGTANINDNTNLHSNFPFSSNFFVPKFVYLIPLSNSKRHFFTFSFGDNRQ